MSLPGLDSFFPERVIRLFESAQIFCDNLLLAPNGIDAFHDRPDVDGLVLSLIILRSRGLQETEGTTIHLHVVYGRIAFAVDEAQEVWLTAMEIGMCELDGLGIIVGVQEALLEG